MIQSYVWVKVEPRESFTTNIDTMHGTILPKILLAVLRPYFNYKLFSTPPDCGIFPFTVRDPKAGNSHVSYKKWEYE